MTEARFLLRFDDACPTSHWPAWDAMEACLDRHGIKPIVAVIPDNQDKSMAFGPPDPAFWDRVRRWQSKGWAIGLHGHTHVYSTSKAGLVPLNRRSEFAGLPEAVQTGKIAAGLACFAREGIKADLWVAPAHSFDRQTLAALFSAGLLVLSDGFFAQPTVDRRGIVWVPQQIWSLEPRSRGVWTVCYHPNAWKTQDVARFDAEVAVFRAQIADLPQVLAEEALPQTARRRAAARLRLVLRKAKLRASRLRAAIGGA